MRWQHVIGLILVVLLITACESKKAEEFIEQENTIKDAKQLVENSMKEQGLDVTAGKVQYDNIGKSTDTSRLVVIYETEHEPIYNGSAFLHVDKEASPRRILGIDHLGLGHTEGLISIGDVLMEHIAKNAYQFTVPIVEDVMQEIPELDWEENEKINLNHVQWQEEKLPELLKLYGEDKLEKLNEEESAQWFEEFKVDSEGKKVELQLNLHYSGEMSNDVFEEILQNFANVEGLWSGSLFVRVKAEQFDASEEPVYNKLSNGKGSSVFIGIINKEK